MLQLGKITWNADAVSGESPARAADRYGADALINGSSGGTGAEALSTAQQGENSSARTFSDPMENFLYQDKSEANYLQGTACEPHSQQYY